MKTPILLALSGLCALGATALAWFVLRDGGEAPPVGLEPQTQVVEEREPRDLEGGARRSPAGAPGGPNSPEREPVVVATPTGGGLSDPLDRPRGVTPEEQRRRLEDQLAGRAERAANELGLASGAEPKLAAVLLEAHDRLQALRADFLAGERTPADREALREAMEAVPAWRLQRLTELFGAENAAAIEAFDDSAAANAAGFQRSDTDG